MTTDAKHSPFDHIKLSAAILLLLGAISGFYFFSDWPLALRVLGMLALTAVALVLFFTTAIGGRLWVFSVASRNELKKVVWPTRQETVQTTLVVIFMVVLVAIFLWLVDMLLKWLVGLLLL
jgi:preprotein translocase subunit SecE